MVTPSNATAPYYLLTGFGEFCQDLISCLISQLSGLPQNVLSIVIVSRNQVNVEVENGKIVLYPEFRHKTLEERIRESGCELSGIGELDWGEPQGNEVW